MLQNASAITSDTGLTTFKIWTSLHKRMRGHWQQGHTNGLQSYCVGRMDKIHTTSVHQGTSNGGSQSSHCMFAVKNHCQLTALKHSLQKLTSHMHTQAMCNISTNPKYTNILTDTAVSLNNYEWINGSGTSRQWYSCLSL